MDEIYVKPLTQLNFDGPLPCGVTTDLIRNAVSLSAALDKVSCVVCLSVCPAFAMCSFMSVLSTGVPCTAFL